MTSTTSSHIAGRGTATRVGLAFVWTASAAVLAAGLLASFRQPFAGDWATLLTANGPRVLFAAAAGGLLALSGALRLSAGPVRPWEELERLALATGAAGGGFVLAQGHRGTIALLLFALGAVLGALLFWTVVRALDRPQRWTNLAVAVVVAALAGTAAFPGSFARARTDFIAPAVAWLLGDLTGVSVTSGLVLLAVLVALVAAASTSGPGRSTTLAWIAMGTAVGAAGPLAFVTLMVPLVVQALSPGASPRAVWLASAAAGAATVVAVDAVPRLLVGGYDFAWNVPATLLAIPGFLTWNRVRLRREAGHTGLTFEILEVTLIAGLTLGATWLAVYLTRLVRLAT